MSSPTMKAENLSLQILELGEGEKLHTYLEIVNTGDQTIAGGWRIYFSLGMELDAQEFRVAKTSVEGRYGYLSATDRWIPLRPGGAIRIEIQVRFLTGMPLKARQGFHLTFQEPDSHEEISLGTPRLLPPVLQPFTSLPNWWIASMSPSADTHAQTPEHVYEKNAAHDVVAKELRIIPGVSEMDIVGEVRVDRFWVEQDQGSTADYTLQILEHRDQLSRNGLPIFFVLTENLVGYRLEVSEERIRIEASAEVGLFHGAQSLRQILDHEHGVVPLVRISDQADFGHRALSLDVARHFFDADQITRTLDAMASYKMNTLQLGISNDEGWRLQIDAVPELTRIGSRRSFNSKDQKASSAINSLYPAWGDNEELSEGYLTKSEMIRILQHAQSRHIEVVLEFNLPGHANALIRSLEGHAEFAVVDPDDKSVHQSVQGFSHNVVNVAMDSTYDFVRVVLQDIAAIYHQADVPLKRIHFGGDETPEGAWLGSPTCQASDVWESEWSTENSQDVEHIRGALMRHHYRQITDVAERVMPGVVTGFWHEMSPYAEGAAGDPKRFFNAWTTEAADRQVVDELLAAGRQVVISNASFLYLDMPYGLHQDEPGLPWGSYIDSELIYEFDPLGVWGVKPERESQILGLQAQLWSETVYSNELMDYYVFPRLLSVAERCWNGRPDSDWPQFANAVGTRELGHLEHLEVRFRVPTPGAIVIDGEVHANVVFPGLAIRYTVDGTTPTSASAVYEQPVPIGAGQTVRLGCGTPGGRFGRIIDIAADTRN